MPSDQAKTDEPLPTFDVLPLSPELRRAVDELGYVHPTPVQCAVFEPASRGRDLVVQARTGTGKTAAFAMPLLDARVPRNVPGVQALVLCPTRELALQVNREVEALAKYRGTRSTAVYGGAPMPKQVEAIQNGAQILVGTPGRVLDHLRRRTLEPSTIRVFVLDESDEMLSMGFLPQISEILGFLPENRQTLLFSATLPPDIRRVAETRLKNPEFLTLSGDHIGALEIQHTVYLSRGDKLAELIQVIEVENPESAIVFCNTRDETKRVAQALQQQGFAADWLNADLAQNDREKVMAATRKGELRFLVCTDVASRGIDISHLTHVINFDFPESAESYVHRTGRTGRAGRTGHAIALIEPGDIGNLYLLKLTYKVKPIERQLPSAVEKKTRAETDLLRWFVDAFENRAMHVDDLALARRLLTHEQAERIVAGLLRDHLGARPDAQEEATAVRRAKTTRATAEPAEVALPERERPERPAARQRPPARPLAQPRPEAKPARPAPIPVPEPQPVHERSNGHAVATDRKLNEDSADELEGDQATPAGCAEIYVSVGRRDGARPSDFQ
ncbi:MAG TPA: DEAD/DEAH box helicase, partial [Polyangiaceae bacterium]